MSPLTSPARPRLLVGLPEARGNNSLRKFTYLSTQVLEYSSTLTQPSPEQLLHKLAEFPIFLQKGDLDLPVGVLADVS